MLILLRTLVISFLMIIIPLINIDLRLGGRYLIILDAILAAFLAQFVRNLIKGHISQWNRAILTGLSVLIVLGLSKLIFSGVNLTVVGMLLIYSGEVFIEFVLPDTTHYHIRLEE